MASDGCRNYSQGNVRGCDLANKISVERNELEITLDAVVREELGHSEYM
jgi:hypothetical protein